MRRAAQFGAQFFGGRNSLGDCVHPIRPSVSLRYDSDIFQTDGSTCRPWLVYGITECIKAAQQQLDWVTPQTPRLTRHIPPLQAAQQGGAGLIVYFRKEGRALGEVTKFMVYNARKRQEGGDSAQTYFKRTEMIAGVQVREKAGHARRSPLHRSHPAPRACRTCASRS